MRFDDHSGRIEATQGRLPLYATSDAFRIEVGTFDPADGPLVLTVVAEHLQRFGFREKLVFDWQIRDEANPAT